MIAIPEGLIPAAEAAGIKVPVDLNNYDRHSYTHWHVYQLSQLGRAIHSGSHWENAEVIAALSVAECEKITPLQLEERGFV